MERNTATYDSPSASLGSPPGSGRGQHADGRVGQLWSQLPAELAAVFRPAIPQVADEVLLEIQLTVPEYAMPLEGGFGRTITVGVRQALLAFLDRLADPAGEPQDRSQLFHRLGQHELNQGRSVDVLQTAYRVGARVAWRRLSEIGTRAGVPTGTLCLLAEAIFAYIDELSALSIDGYAEAQERAVGTQERRRRRLLEALLGQQQPSRQSLAELARAARWELPERIVTVAIEARADQHELSPPPLGADVLMNFEDGAPVLVLAAPDEARGERLEADLRGWRAAIGPEVPLPDAARSLQWARRALGLMAAGVLPDSPVVWCERHLSTLWLLQDTFLVRELVRRVLAPLTGLTQRQHERLADTLLAWLETRGNVREVAQRLSVHPQTVRSRLQELQGLFGDRLDDPQARFEMVLALRALRTLGDVTELDLD